MRPGPVDLDEYDPHAKTGVQGVEAGRPSRGCNSLVKHAEDLQERLFAEAHGDREGRAVLLVLQGMDTSGKGGTSGTAWGRSTRRV